MPVGEGSPLPTNLCKNGRRNASPTDKTSKFTTNLVGTGVLDGPNRADMESAPTGLVVFPKLMPVGEDIILPCMTIPPSFSCENATSLYTREALFGVPALLFGVIFIDCRGGHWSSAGVQRTPLRV